MNTQEEIEKKIEKSKEYSIKDAAFVNITSGLGDNYISAYGIALGASAFHIGLLSSLPTLLGTFSQIFSSKFMEKFSRKKIFAVSIFWQSLFWLPIIFVSLLYIKGFLLAPVFLIVFYTIYSILGYFASPAWVSWIGDLVKVKELGKFFSKRNFVGGIFNLFAIIIGGIILNFFQKKEKENNFVFVGFGILFLLAMIFRFVSRYFVLKQYEPEFRFKKEYYFSFKDFLKEAYKRDFGRFALFLSSFVFVCNIAGPFYTLYMLKDLGLFYLQFMIVVVAGSIGGIIFLPLWGRFIDEYGNIYTLQITSLMIPLICFLWPLSSVFDGWAKIYFLMIANFFSGFSWGGFNLAAGNYLYESVSSQKRSLCAAYSSILSGFSGVCGSILGSFLISHLYFKTINIIMFVSLVSGFLRYLVAFIFTPRLIEIREIKHKPTIKNIPFFGEILNIPVYFQNIFVTPIKKRFKKINQSE